MPKTQQEKKKKKRENGITKASIRSKHRHNPMVVTENCSFERRQL